MHGTNFICFLFNYFYFEIYAFKKNIISQFETKTFDIYKGNTSEAFQNKSNKDFFYFLRVARMTFKSFM